MKSLSPATVNNVLSLLDSGTSAREISAQTGVSVAFISNIRSEHCPNLSKAFGGCPAKLSENNICHGIHLISSGKVDNAVQVKKVL